MVDPTNTGLYQSLSIQALGGNAPVPGDLLGPKPGVQPILPSGRPGQRIEMPWNTKAMEMNYPPQPNAAAQPSWQTFADPENPGSFRSFLLPPGGTPPGYDPQKGTLRAGNSAPQSTWTKTDIVDETYDVQLGNVIRMKGNRAAREQGINYWMDQRISNSKAKPEIKAAATQALKFYRDQKANGRLVTVDEFMQGAQGDAKDIADLRTLLGPLDIINKEIQ